MARSDIEKTGGSQSQLPESVAPNVGVENPTSPLHTTGGRETIIGHPLEAGRRRFAEPMGKRNVNNKQSLKKP